MAVFADMLFLLKVSDRTGFGPYLHPAFLLLACLGCLVSWRRHRRVSWFNGFALPTLGATLLSLAFLSAIVASSIDYRQTRIIDEAAIDLPLPLRHGTYAIIQGGAEEITNHHVAIPAQKHAIDIVKIGEEGRRTRSLWPQDLKDYLIYSEPVFAPCSGTILTTSNMLKDLPPPETAPFSIAGNHVILFCQNTSLLFAHLQQGSVQVKPGDFVKASEPLARVGNTGNTSEPHLHLQAVRGRVEDITQILRDAEPVPVRWNGRFLIRNDRVKVP